MTALVTGAGGFLGRHVVAHLQALGIPTVTLGRAGDIVLPNPSDASVIFEAVAKVSPSLIFHLAGTTATDSVEEAYRVNVLFGAHLLTAARKMSSPPRVLLAGSAAEYGSVDEGLLPIVEDTACRPTSVYGITKLAQTLHGIAAAADGLPVVVARLFNVIGRDMPVHLALGAFAAQIRAMPNAGGVLRTGPLARWRDFVEVEATAAVLVALARDAAANGQVVNVCSGVPTSLASFTEALISSAGCPVVLQEEVGRHGNSGMIRHWGSTARLGSLGYRLLSPNPARVASALLGK